ncbi:MAG: hypothetical protein Ct9H90mP18_01150 [Gammaproteobacteria bacterium]|nr:MAG: hypothetical protein Ct9H90mP18_01150 [Gammaproteobacteria bacterium]
MNIVSHIKELKTLGFNQYKRFVNALGALTGNQALQQAKAGLKAVYLSGWQVR